MNLLIDEDEEQEKRYIQEARKERGDEKDFIDDGKIKKHRGRQGKSTNGGKRSEKIRKKEETFEIHRFCDAYIQRSTRGRRQT